MRSNHDVGRYHGRDDQELAFSSAEHPRRPDWPRGQTPSNPRSIPTIVERRDHHIVVAELTEVHLPNPVTGRADQAILAMANLGGTVFYGN